MEHDASLTRLEWPFLKMTAYVNHGKLIYALKCPVPKPYFRFDHNCISLGFKHKDYTKGIVFGFNLNHVTYKWNKYRNGYYTNICKLHVPAAGKQMQYKEAMK